MASLSEIVKPHVDAIVEEAAGIGYPKDDVARTMLAFVMQLFRESATTEEIIAELNYVVDNLDPNREYTFMRP